MKTKVGLWIDKKTAIIVFASSKKVEKIIVKHNIDHALESANISPVEIASRQQEFLFNNTAPENAGYFRDIITTIKKAESILLFGNEESTRIMKYQLAISNLSGNIATTETYDNLLVRQVTSRVQHYFQRREDRIVKG